MLTLAMEYPFVVFHHVIAGILWAGGAIAAGFFIIPAVLDAGPAGGAVMAGVAKRRFPVMLTVAAVLVVLTGARLYMVRFTPGWLTAPEGIVITLGALLAVGAFAIGFFIQRPAVERMAFMPPIAGGAAMALHRFASAL